MRRELFYYFGKNIVPVSEVWPFIKSLSRVWNWSLRFSLLSDHSLCHISIKFLDGVPHHTQWYCGMCTYCTISFPHWTNILVDRHIIKKAISASCEKKKEKRIEGGVTAQSPLPTADLQFFFSSLLMGYFLMTLRFTCVAILLGMTWHSVRKFNGSLTEGVILEWNKPYESIWSILNPKEWFDRRSNPRDWNSIFPYYFHM